MPDGFFYLNSLDRSISYIRGVWLVFYHYHVLQKCLYLMRSVASDLVYTVCQCLFYGTLGLNGLIYMYIGHGNHVMTFVHSVV